MRSSVSPIIGHETRFTYRWEQHFGNDIKLLYYASVRPKLEYRSAISISYRKYLINTIERVCSRNFYGLLVVACVLVGVDNYAS